jgi:phosphoribosylanthranilate isomerase
VKNSLISLFQEKDTLYRVLDYYRPDYIHFCESLTDKHGREMDLDRYIDLQVRIRERFPEVGIIRSIPIPEENAAPKYPTLKIAERMEPVSDLFLTDTWLEQEPGDVIGEERENWSFNPKYPLSSREAFLRTTFMRV